MSASQLLALPSQHEALPTTLMEAAACGRPVIATDVDGIPEIVAHEVTGLVLSEVSPPQIAGEVVRLLNDSQTLAAMSRSGKERAREQFSSVHVARTVAEAIHKLPIGPNVESAPGKSIASVA